jgi:hypothetical protein
LARVGDGSKLAHRCTLCTNQLNGVALSIAATRGGSGIQARYPVHGKRAIHIDGQKSICDGNFQGTGPFFNTTAGGELFDEDSEVALRFW